MAHGILNTSIPILVEDQFVCPVRPLEVDHHIKTHKNYVQVSQNLKGINIRKGSVVALKANRRRLFQGKFVNKPEGKLRRVLKVRDYRFAGQFDKSAFQILVGDRAPCTALPAIHTARQVDISEGEFPLDNVTLKTL